MFSTKFSARLVLLLAVACAVAPALAQESTMAKLDDSKNMIYELLANRHNLPNLGAQVMKPNLGLLDYAVAKPTLGKPAAPNLDLLNYGAQALKKPNYMAKMFQPDMEVMTQTWQQAIDAATGATGMKSEGTWSINDMVKALQKNLQTLANGTAAANATTAAAAAGNATEPAAPAGPTFGEFASGLLCPGGLQLANCSGVNPCKTKRCGPAAMCMVDQCGGCNAKCVSFLELGAGINKVLNTVGMKPVLPGPVDAPTPNLPIIDKLVKGAEKLAHQVLPKCNLNQFLDLKSFSCVPCAEGSVAAQGAKACAVCGRGKYAELKSGACKSCSPGYFAASATGEPGVCMPCAVNTYSNTPGASACLPCTGGLGTRGMKGQSKCIKQF